VDELDSILNILDEALKLDFEAVNDSKPANGNDSSIVSQKVLEMLCEKLGADGGNFSVFDVPSNTLDVKGRFSKSSVEPKLSFAEFRDLFRDIGKGATKRKESTSYRCLDSGETVFVEVSTLENESTKTLSVGDLECKAGLSAIAVPIIFHDHVIGIINIDSNSPHCFDEAKATFLTGCAKVLAPTIYNSILVDAVTRISRASSGITNDYLNEVCDFAARTTFSSYVAIYKQDEALEDQLNRVGSNSASKRTSCRVEFEDNVRLNNAQNQLTEYPDLITSTSYAHTNITPIKSDIFVEYIACKLEDDTRMFQGIIYFVNRKPDLWNKAFKNIGIYIARCVSATMKTRADFERNVEAKYETTAHQLARNLNALSVNVARLKRYISPAKAEAIKLMRENPTNLRVVEMTVGAYRLLQMDTAITVLNENVGYASDTVRTIIDGDRYKTYLDERLPTKNPWTNEPLLAEALRRHINYKNLFRPKQISILSMTRSALNAQRNRYHRTHQSDVQFELIHDAESYFATVEKRNLEVLIGNMVENAFKYSPPMTQIVVELVRYEFQISWRISNTGPHIEEWEKADIFKKGVRGENVVTSPQHEHYAGLGIGLWESSHISRLWGGGRPLRLVHSQPLTSDKLARVCFEILIPSAP
jgi:signal transduction histidine kinase